ncbi:MAG: hypothetical protein HF975_04515 [ANME-2 cluster archaeon]|nr:hypothetical protein [ANME-2 cluster archaeon]
MANCTNQDVIDITGTSLDTAIIDRIITGSDRKINRYLRQNGIPINPSPVPDDIMDASIYFSAATVLNRHMVDGTLPAQYKAENLSEQVDVKTVISNYETDAIAALQLYAEDQVTDSGFSMVRVVGRGGERVGEYETMSEAQEAET